MIKDVENNAIKSNLSLEVSKDESYDVAREMLKYLLQNNELVSEREKEAVIYILNSLKSEYKSQILSEFERACIFDSRKLTKGILLYKLQSAIIEFVDFLARKYDLQYNGFITSYESKMLLKRYFLCKVINVKDSSIKNFVKDVAARLVD